MVFDLDEPLVAAAFRIMPVNMSTSAPGIHLGPTWKHGIIIVRLEWHSLNRREKGFWQSDHFLMRIKD